MASRLTLRTVVRSQTIWTRPVSTTGLRAADKDDKTMYEKVKDKAGEFPKACIKVETLPRGLMGNWKLPSRQASESEGHSAGYFGISV